MMDFIILGLPRSGTTWIANWLTTDKTLCLHDPFEIGSASTWPRDHRLFGISCTASYLLPGWLNRHDCKVAIIERDPDACHASIQRIGFDKDDKRMQTLKRSLDAVEGRRFPFDDIWSESKARELMAYLMPGITFDAIRYNQLKRMQVQPYMPAFTKTELVKIGESSCQPVG